MKYFISPNVGRTFIVSMVKGDLLRESLIELAEKEGIENAVVISGIATFDEARIHMVTNHGFPVDIHVEHLVEPLELASLDGAIIDSFPHLHCVVSNATTTWAGHILDGCRILFLGEIVIQELLGVELERIEDSNGIPHICEK